MIYNIHIHVHVQYVHNVLNENNVIRFITCYKVKNSIELDQIQNDRCLIKLEVFLARNVKMKYMYKLNQECVYVQYLITAS